MQIDKEWTTIPTRAFPLPPNIPLILGSSSQTRRAILEKTGWPFTAMSPSTDEKSVQHASPHELARQIALDKAAALCDRLDKGGEAKEAILLTCDQVVVFRGTEVRGKPDSADQAAAFLSSYSRNSVSTLSAVVATHYPSRAQVSEVDVATVHWAEIPDAVVRSVVARGDVLYSSGGFCIEDAELVERVRRVEGTMDSVMGLPLDATVRVIQGSMDAAGTAVATATAIATATTTSTSSKRKTSKGAAATGPREKKIRGESKAESKAESKQEKDEEKNQDGGDSAGGVASAASWTFPPWEPTLCRRHAHPRDAHILFDEPTHKYTILTDAESKYTSVTTFVHSLFATFDADKIIAKMRAGRNWNPSNKYFLMSDEEIKKQWSDAGSSACRVGTQMHKQIEDLYQIPPAMMGLHVPAVSPSPSSLPSSPPSPSPSPLPPLVFSHAQMLAALRQLYPDPVKERFAPEIGVEMDYFFEYLRDTPHLKPYRTEWMIYDEDIKISGSVDMVYQNPEDGTLSIYDWKRSKGIDATNHFGKRALPEALSHVHDTNYWHYALQLNMYKYILENKYGKKVRELCLVRIYPCAASLVEREEGGMEEDTAQSTYELIRLPILEKEMAILVQMRLDGAVAAH